MLRPRLKPLYCAALLLALATSLSAQIVTQDTSELTLHNRDARAAVAPANTAATFIEIIADPALVGGDLINVTSDRPGVAVSLVLPNGTEVNASNFEAAGFGMTVIGADEPRSGPIPTFLSAPGTHTLFIFPAGAVPGVYKIKLDSTNVNTQTLVLANYFSSSQIRAGVDTDGLYRVGDPVVIAGVVLDNTTPVVGAQVKAVIDDTENPAAAPREVVLNDFGPGDEATGDGIYSAIIAAERAGKFSVALHVTGTTAAGVRYSRVASKSFEVIQPPASFTSFGDESADDDFDGRLDRIAVNANLDVQTAGKYQFTVTLVASNGKELNANGFAELQQGARRISASFTAGALFSALGVGGPYRIKDALLTLEGTPDDTLADFRRDVGQTGAYTLSGLGPKLSFTGNNSAQGIDANGNGKFDFLAARAEVAVVNPGFYEWSGILMDPSGGELAFASGEGFLSAGNNTITFNFDGRRIGGQGQDGPYSIESVLIAGGGTSKVVNKLFTTQPFTASQFETAPPRMRFGSATASAAGGDGDKYIEPGENGEILVRLFNDGDGSARNVTATLTSTTPGVTVTSATSAYADIVPSTSGVNTTPFGFALAGNVACGQTVAFTLTVRHAADGGIPLVYNFTARTGQPGQPQTFSYAGQPLAIPADGSYVNIPFAVSGLNSVDDINVRLDNIDYGFVGALEITLTSPRGTTVRVKSFTWDGGSRFRNTIIDEEGGGPSIQSIVWFNEPYTGTYTPFESLAAFRGEDPNGTWTLSIADPYYYWFYSGAVNGVSLVVTGSECAANGGGDATAPVSTASPSAAPNAAGWNNADVTLALSATDEPGGSGVRDITYSTSGAQTTAATTVGGASAALTLSAEGTTTVTYYATDNAGNAEQPRTFTVKLDKTAPTINVVSPSASHVLNQTLAADYACSDAGSGVTSCAGSVPNGGALDTSSVGTKQFGVAATDAAGNTATRSIAYAVGYAVRLKYDASKAHQSGSTVPVKLQLVDANGVNVSDQNIVVHALRTVMLSNYAPGEVEDAGNANPDDDFRFTNFDGQGGYIFNLKTNGMMTTGTYMLVFSAGADPLTHGAQFQIK